MTSKIHAVVDSNGLPVRLPLNLGEAHEVRLAGKLLSRLTPGSMPLADRGYDTDWKRELAMKKSSWANIPPKSNHSDPICFSPYLYRARNQVGRFFNRIKQCRRAQTRYDKLAGDYLAFVQLDLSGYGWPRIMSPHPNSTSLDSDLNSSPILFAQMLAYR